ncbi:5531_t:CDS:2 [Gigaspora margarita]|uniref:5531_t:CDS:1 n=1 Tax=Gigaspora margarita TaxID=4874 RepID=A0ABM8W2S8_GIGMA|nr:5531_t:CDS:2 [Gigaspora margarita]
MSYRKQAQYYYCNKVGHEYASCFSKQLINQNFECALSKEMWKLYEKLLPKSIDEEKRKNFVKKIERSLNYEWPNFEIKVNMFGIQNDEKFSPSIAPVISIDRFNAKEWKIYNENILERKRQTKIDLDWAEVYSKFIMFKSIYNSIKTQMFVAENLKIKEINKMIRQAIPESMISEISKLRKIYEFTVIVIENENINFENFLVKI